MNAVPTEHEEQVRFVQWFKRRFPNVRILAIPNGGQRNVVVAAKMKAEGVSRGVPDLYVPAWGLWIEMKRAKGGTVSPEQKDWIAYLESIGQTVIVAKGDDDAIAKVSAFI